MLSGYGTGVEPQSGQWLADVAYLAHINSAAVMNSMVDVKVNAIEIEIEIEEKEKGVGG